MVPKLIAAVLVLGGGLSTFTGVTAQARAVKCHPLPVKFPAVCVPAHQLRPHEVDPTRPNMDCRVWMAFWCIPGADSQCGMIEGYGAAQKGICKHKITQHFLFHCDEDYYQTILAMEYLSSTCVFEDNVCACMYAVGAQPTGVVSICTCRQGTGDPYEVDERE